jgi:hypothetical protein
MPEVPEDVPAESPTDPRTIARQIADLVAVFLAIHDNGHEQWPALASAVAAVTGPVADELRPAFEQRPGRASERLDLLDDLARRWASPLLATLAEALRANTVPTAYLLAVAQASGTAETRPAPSRPAGPAAGERWTIDEEDRLRGAFNDGRSIEELADAHGRSRGGIQARLERLGLLARPAPLDPTAPSEPPGSATT